MQGALEAKKNYNYIFRKSRGEPVVPVDCGMRIGGSTVHACKQVGGLENVKVYAYEPVKDYFKLAKMNVEFNGMSEIAALKQTGSSNNNCWSFIQRPNKFSQRYRDSRVQAAAQSHRPEEVHLLDVRQEFLMWIEGLQHGGQLLIEVDVEGLEIIVVTRLLHEHRRQARNFTFEGCCGIIS